MATTKTKKNTKSEKAVAEKGKSHPLVHGPRVTEKGALGSEKGIYTFNVAEKATKSEIKKAMKMLYGVTPRKVTVTQIAKKVVFRGGAWGTKKGGKKAVVYLKKGDKITLA